MVSRLEAQDSEDRYPLDTVPGALRVFDKVDEQLLPTSLPMIMYFYLIE